MLNAPHAEEARSAVSKHALRLSHAFLVMVATLSSSAIRAEQALDLAKYGCMRTHNGKTVAGDTLVAQGFKIASVGRFGQANVMLADPKTSARANCLVRTEGPN